MEFTDYLNAVLYLVVTPAFFLIGGVIEYFNREKPNVTCVNCKTSLKDPGTNLCSNCGLDLYIVQKDSAKVIWQTDEPKLDHNEHTVTCINCNFSVLNPTTNLCSNCGLDMLIKFSYRNCASCGSDYDSQLTVCPICGAN